ncbi:hypothetical protein HIM_02942 [Hirsutella minnesotensis 3608]|nr:hypothetical protein HIM_02942 [Hirsutella minnesotensis 3608]
MDDYILTRDAEESIRLDALHLLTKSHLNYLLHPSIPIRKDMRIADVGCGSAIWLLDLSCSVPESVQLDGYDISDKQFPQGQLLPPNVSLGLLDSFQDPPPELRGRYDVVHLRAFVVVLRKRDVNLVISNAMKMLRPGGYIQWEDADLTHHVFNTQAGKELEKSHLDLLDAQGIEVSWVSDLAESMRKNGLKVVQVKRDAIPKPYTHLGTRLTLLSYKKIIEMIHGMPTSESGNDVARRALQCRESVTKLLEQCHQGLVFCYSPVAVLASIPGLAQDMEGNGRL